MKKRTVKVRFLMISPAAMISLRDDIVQAR